MPTTTPIPRCRDHHGLDDTISRTSLIIGRGWDEDEVEDVLGPPEVFGVHVEFPRGIIPGGEDRFCAGRVLLAEVVDARIGPTFGPSHREAYRQIRAGGAVSIRSGQGRWYVLGRTDKARVGARMVSASDPHGEGRKITRIGLSWRGVSVITLAPAPHPSLTPPLQSYLTWGEGRGEVA